MIDVNILLSLWRGDYLWHIKIEYFNIQQGFTADCSSGVNIINEDICGVHVPMHNTSSVHIVQSWQYWFYNLFRNFFTIFVIFFEVIYYVAKYTRTKNLFHD